MPLVRIDVNKDVTVELIHVISEAIYDAMIGPAKVPEHDRYQIVTRHTADELIYPKEGYLGLTYSHSLIYIQVTWVGGRSTEQKKKFYQQVATDIATKGKVRKEDIFINLVDSSPEDWSFGNGLMQYGPK
jgi:4-oxalocrotonate tautomerase